jgi:hypothetical protein
VDGCITKALRWPGRRAPHGDTAAWSGPLVGSCCLPCSRAGPHLEPVGKGWPSRDARLGRRPPSHTGGRDGRSRPGRLDTARVPGRTAQGRTPSGRSPPQPTVWGTESFVISYSQANPHGWTTADDQRNASGHAVGRGGRPPWCPLVPSSRPSQGVHLGRLSGRVSEWVSSRRFRSVHPDRLSWLEGAGEQDERALAIGEAALGPDHPTVAGYPRQRRRRCPGLKDASAEVYLGAV